MHSTPSTTSWPGRSSASPPRPRWSRSHEASFQHCAEKREFLEGRRGPVVRSGEQAARGARSVVPRGSTTEVAIVSRASITKAHNKIQELSWDPTYVSPVEKYATDY